MKAVIGTKGTMSQIWQGEKVIPVTRIQVAPNTISIVRTASRDGYSAIQLSAGRMKREFRTDGVVDLKVGDTIDVSAFAEGDLIKVSGLTKGRGFQGGVKRHGFRGGPKTHGQKNRLRAPGSIGATAPQRVVPGMRMAGHMGVERVSVKNLKVVGIDKEGNALLVRGSVPGARGGILEVRGVEKK